MRNLDDGWIEIGKRCSANRRSLWLRINYSESTATITDYDTVTSIELCAGREGDDAYVLLDKSDSKFTLLLDLFSTQRFAVES